MQTHLYQSVTAVLLKHPDKNDKVLMPLWFSSCFLLPCRLSEGGEVGDDKVVTELRTELWEKERKLTDIRLEALSSAHRLEQLQEAMSKDRKSVV